MKKPVEQKKVQNPRYKRCFLRHSLIIKKGSVQLGRKNTGAHDIRHIFYSSDSRALHCNRVVEIHDGFFVADDAVDEVVYLSTPFP